IRPDLCKQSGTMPGLPRLLHALGAGSSEAARIAVASMTGVAAAVGALSRKAATPVQLLPSNDSQYDLSDTAQVEAAAAGPWSAPRLRETLRTNLENDRVIVLANRQPCIHKRRPT